MQPLGWRIEPKSTDKPIADPRAVLQVETAFGEESREAVDALADRAIAAGGREPRPAQDVGFMYSRSFDDPDGNLFSAIWMDPTGEPPHE